MPPIPRPQSQGLGIPSDSIAAVLANMSGFYNVAAYVAAGLTVAAAVTQAIADANTNPGGIVVIPASVPAGGSITGLGATTLVLDARTGVLTITGGTGATLGFTGQTNGAGAATGTLTNAPAATNPTFWLPIQIGGVTKFIPCW